MRLLRANLLAALLAALLAGLSACNSLWGLDFLEYDADAGEQEPIREVALPELLGYMSKTWVGDELVDDGLVVRYFLDEAAAGQVMCALQDDAPDPLALPITYGPELSFFEGGGNRGLIWSAEAQNARASVSVFGGKIHEALHGSTAATLEVVIDVQAVTPAHSRLLHIGEGMQSGYLTLSAPDDEGINLWWQGDTLLGRWLVDWTQRRVVMHAVIDTTEQEKWHRARLYLDGVNLLSPNPALSDPATLNQLIVIEPTSFFVLGNREIGERSFDGALHYAAVYSVALDSEQVQHNAALLAESDDL